MPDLVTHVTVAHLFRLLRGRIRNHRDIGMNLLLFYWGTILPDLLTRPLYILFPETHHWLLPFHTPLGMGVFSLMIAVLFPVNLRRSAFLNLFGGAMFHFFMDLLQKQVIGNHFWLFPFSWSSRGLGLAWPHEIMKLIPIWIILIILLDGERGWKSIKKTSNHISTHKRQNLKKSITVSDNAIDFFAVNF